MNNYYNNAEIDMMQEWVQQGGVILPPQPVFLPLGRNGRVLIPIGAYPHGYPLPPNVAPQPLFPAINPKANMHIHGEGPPQMRKLFIGGLNHETTDEQIRQYFSKWGPVVDSIVIREPTSKQSRGFGFVTFGTFAAAEAAMNERPHHIGGKIVDSKRAIPREQMMPLIHSPLFDFDMNPGCKLTITGIHCDFHSVEALRIYFETFGTLEQVEILGKPRGVGFVIFERRDDADRCLSHKGGRHFVNDKRIDVRPAPPSHYRQWWKRRGQGPPPLIPLLDHFSAMALQQQYPMMQGPYGPVPMHPVHQQIGTPVYSEEDSSYGFSSTEDEGKIYDESSEQESNEENSGPELSRKSSA